MARTCPMGGRAELPESSGHRAGMAMIGPARVSTSDQVPEAPAARLREHGCARVFTDHGVTGRPDGRSGMPAARTCTTATSGSSDEERSPRLT